MERWPAHCTNTTFELLAVGRALDRAAVGGQRQLLQAGLVDHVRGLAVAEFRQLAGVIALRAPEAMMMAPKFSVVVAPDSVEMSAEKRPGAPLVLVMVELRCTVILLSRLDSRDHVVDAGVFRVGIGAWTPGCACTRWRGAAQHAALLDDGDRVAGRGGLDGRRHADDAAADHQQLVVAGRRVVDCPAASCT